MDTIKLTPENKLEDLFSNRKKTLINQRQTKPQDTLEFKTQQPSKTLSFNTTLEVERD